MAKITDTAKYIKEKWEENANQTRERHEDWYNNIAFYQGYQWQSWSSNTYAYLSPPAEDTNGLLMLVGNLIQPLADMRMSKILGTRPVINVVSVNKDAAAIEKAENETKILKAVWQDLNVPTFLMHTVKWSVVNNHCFARPYWDANWGESQPNPKYVEGISENEPESFQRGRIRMDLLNPFKIQFDTSFDTWDDVRCFGWVSIKSIQTVDSLLRMYPEKASVIKQLKASSSLEINSIEEKTLRMEDTGSAEQRTRDRNLEDEEKFVLVYEFYQSPCRNYPEGMYFVSCQDKLLHEKSLKRCKIPVFHFPDRMGFMTQWGKSLVSGSRQRQKQYNLLLSKIFSYARLAPIYGIPRNSGIDVDTIPDRAYIITEYDTEEGAPIIIAPPQMPEAWLFLLAHIQSDLEHFWGTHEVSMRGTTPSNNRLSGRGIYLLQEGDFQRLTPVMTIWDDMLSDLGEELLCLARNYKETQKMYYTGEDGRDHAVHFTGDQISEYLKVKIEVGSDFMRNQQATQQFVMGLLQVLPNLPLVQQALADPVTAHKVFSFVSESFANTLLYRNKDMQVADRENRMLLEDKKVVETETWHNAASHIAGHTDMMNSSEWERLDKNLREEFYRKHFAAHVGARAKELPPQVQAGLPGNPLSNQPAGGGGQVVRRSPNEQPKEPAMTAIDQRVESMVQPSGQPGTEETP